MLLAALVGACSSAKTPEELVQARATQRWNHLLANEFEKAYTFLPPSSRAVVSEQAFINSFARDGSVKWQSANFTSVECPDEERCLARFRVETKINMPGFKGQVVETTVEETWLKEDGQWWFFRR